MTSNDSYTEDKILSLLVELKHDTAQMQANFETFKNNHEKEHENLRDNIIEKKELMLTLNKIDSGQCEMREWISSFKNSQLWQFETYYIFFQTSLGKMILNVIFYFLIIIVCYVASKFSTNIRDLLEKHLGEFLVGNALSISLMRIIGDKFKTKD